MNEIFSLGVQPPRQKVFVLERYVVQTNCGVEEFVPSRDGEDVLRDLANDSRTGITGPVDPVSETRKDSFLPLDLFPNKRSGKLSFVSQLKKRNGTEENRGK